MYNLDEEIRIAGMEARAALGDAVDHEVNMMKSISKKYFASANLDAEQLIVELERALANALVVREKSRERVLTHGIKGVPNMNKQEQRSTGMNAQQQERDAALDGEILAGRERIINRFKIRVHDLIHEPREVEGVACNFDELAETWAYKLGPGHPVVRKLYIARADLESARDMLRKAVGEMAQYFVDERKKDEIS